jgi:hypothetical protein
LVSQWRVPRREQAKERRARLKLNHCIGLKSTVEPRVSSSEIRDALPITKLETVIVQGGFPERLDAAKGAH